MENGRVADVQVQVQPEAYPVQPWTQVAQGIQAGSWAVLLVLGVIVWLAKDPLKNYLAKQAEVLDVVKDNQRINTETLKQLADTDSRTAEVLGEMAKAAESRHSEVMTALSKLGSK